MKAHLTNEQTDAIDGLVNAGYENSAQIAKMLGLTHEFVAEYVASLEGVQG